MLELYMPSHDVHDPLRILAQYIGIVYPCFYTYGVVMYHDAQTVMYYDTQTGNVL
jgi:hypothetical protein